MMKKFLCALFAALLTVCSAFALCACNSDPAQTTTAAPTKQPPVIPEGYALYSDGTIAFSYPGNWSKTVQGNITVLTNPTGQGNNITVTYEPKTDMYATMTAQDFTDVIKPTYDALGLEISGVSVTQTTNDFYEIAITRISFTTKAGTVSMAQTLFIHTFGERTYSVSVTEATSDVTLRETVFQTLHQAQ